MTTQIIRNTEGVVTTGKFCLFNSQKSNSGEPITLPNVEFPPANGLALFNIPTLNHRYSINVDNTNISGTVDEVAKILHDEFQIYVTYAKHPDAGYLLIFSNMIIDVESRKIGVKGITPLDVPDSGIALCEVITVDETHLFALRQRFSFAEIPIIADGRYDIRATRFKYSIYNNPTDTTPLNTSGYIEVPTHSDLDQLMYSLVDEFNGYMGFNATHFSSNITQFKVNVDHWFDFSQETENNIFDLLKGYAPITGQAT